MKQIRSYLPLLAGLGAMAALILCPAEAADGARRGLMTCAQLLIPSLLPFFIVSALLRAWGLPGVLGRLLGSVTARLWGLPGCVTSAFLLGVTGGYPMGAATVAALRRDGTLSRADAQRALQFCNGSGPAFLIGAAGSGVFHSSAAGLTLYGAHVLAAVLLGMLTAPRKTPPVEAERCQIETIRAAEALPAAVRESVDAVLAVCGFVVLFGAAATLADGYLRTLAMQLHTLTGMELTAARALFTGLLELGSGLGAMQHFAPTAGNLALAAFLTGFGGISVQAQTAAVLAGTDLDTAKAAAWKLLHGALAAGLTLLLWRA